MEKTALISKEEEQTASSVRILGKRIKLAPDYDPDGKDADTIIRTAVPFEMKSLNDDERTIEFIGSTATRDRYGDSIVQTGWELGNFVKNPVIPWGHNYHEPPVAKAVEVGLREGNLFFKGQFATADEYEYADTIYKLYKGGYLRAFSVGFIPLEWELQREYDDDGVLTDIWWVFTKCELLEVSCVTVPANPEALTLAFREGVLNPHDKTMMLKQVNKLKSILTESEDSSINNGMNDETKSYIDEKFAELKSLIVGKDAEEEVTPPADADADEAGANPSEETDGGTPESTVDADELKKAVEDAIDNKIAAALGTIK